MRRFLFVLTVAAGAWSTQAAAQMPTGSYVQSCRDMRFDGYTLSAVCNAMQGPPQRTAIRVDSCPGPIANFNGQLVCEGGGRGQRDGRDGRYGRGEPPYGGGPPPYDRRGGYDRDDWRGPPPGYRESDRRYDGPPGGGYGRPGYGPPPGQPPAPPAPPPQARPAMPGGGGGGGLPPGSWAASCSGGSMQGTILVAACRDAMGNLHSASIDVRACKSVANQNGRLVCG